ncbi:MAG TPA: rhomboid family intramembrane serine protease [Thiobacillaceae bacterium]|nr:rhomboid family intramembrane serine protease [Thiobacillaceae bacterium]
MQPVTRALLIANVTLFLAQMFASAELRNVFALWPPGSPRYHLWQLLSYAFLHGSVAHIGLNMLALWMFGSELERLWGGRRLLLTYLISVLVAALTQIVVSGYLFGSGGPMIGASGGVFGLLLAYALYFPNRRVMLLIPPIPMRSRTFVMVYAALELFLGVTQTQAGVAHFAHLGGLFGGWLGVQYFRGRGLFGPR